ncbi:alpha/beta-hydrolase [Auricularia subglabra TFB-10046 SS5]|nr:alpha/beta-hydrolase [Auricularia subglabra TFB-10046 SS5]
MLPIVAGFIVATLCALTAAAPAALESRQAVTALSDAQIASYRPYALFSRAVGCSPEATPTWTCGAPCDALPGFLPAVSGGDGDAEQYWNRWFKTASLNNPSVVRSSHSCSLPILTDLDFDLAPLNKTLFPGVPEAASVHNGFRKEHERSADRILAAVKIILVAHPGAAVTCTGHSLGGALSILDAVLLRLQLPSTTPVKFVGFGTPGVGNPAFADHVDAVLPDFSRINNKQDPVPKLPRQDSKAAGCINDTERTIFNATGSDHTGPYDGIFLDGSCH